MLWIITQPIGTSRNDKESEDWTKARDMHVRSWGEGEEEEFGGRDDGAAGSVFKSVGSDI